ncbi:hypothetical protein HG536_0A07570 [Torulaspora globosa]|uniref:Proteasome assembly chaperone 3 n=1 Tax=Torulaspora globosa TaxID=48254 RepID=A0A7G3ZBQ6_9SACH|nr:uncharacterized protein HG536_0A07570 [Torulaspora globosa]QLL30942.1 hypothetical protein HG536_0A07570 [Torulaspora globosa]
MSCVKTLVHTVDSPLYGAVELVATIPTELENARIPISVVLGFADDSAEAPMRLLSYHYALPYRTTQQVVGTALLDTSNDWVRDVTRQLATLISKKFGRPCYVGWSNGAGQQRSVDQLFVIKQCIQFISDNYAS